MANKSRTFETILLAGLLLVPSALTGCGQRAPVAVSGRVTLDGKPLSEAVILFVPLTPDRKKTGAEIVDGVYRLSSEFGLLPGTYRAEIADNPPLHLTSARAGNYYQGTRDRRSFPSRYSHDSPFTIECPQDSNSTFDFELTTPQKAGH